MLQRQSTNWLQDIVGGSPPQYGALVFDDDVSSGIVAAATSGFGIEYNISAVQLPSEAATVAYSLLGATPQGR